jgi:hypothetical protein
MMKSQDDRNRYLIRNRVLNLMSDEEIARVSTAESALRLEDGEYYLDLEALERGVQRASGPQTAMGHVLPRKAVGDLTWEKILRELAGAQVSPPRSGVRTDDSY